MTAHVQSRHRIGLPVAADVALPFFTPIGEEHWVEGWRPEYLWPRYKSNRPGTVFTTGSGAQTTIWLVADYDTRARRARYVRTTPGVRTGTVEVSVLPLGVEACEVTVEYAMTALCDSLDGADPLAPYRGEAFSAMVEGWKAEIEKALPRLLGQKLS